MSLEQERIDIETYFAAQWGNTTPIGFDGQEFTYQADSVRLTIQNAGAAQMSLGAPSANLVRNTGLIYIEIVTEGGRGSNAARKYADTIMGFMQNQKIGTVKTQIPFVSARRNEAPFFIMNVAVPFTRDEFSA